MNILRFNIVLVLGIVFSFNFAFAQNTQNQNPILKEISKIGFTDDDSPEYKFSSTHEGDLTYSGKCKSSIEKAKIGENIIILDSLLNGIYFDCRIKLKDIFGKISNELSISRFTINKGVTSNSNNGGGSGGGGGGLGGLTGALAGALGGAGGGDSDCKETGPPKCPSQTLKISPQQCKTKGKNGKPSDAVKQAIKSFKQHNKKFDKNVTQKIHQDNQANPQCNNKFAAKQLHHYGRCMRDVQEGYLKDCSSANSAGIITPLQNYAFHNDSVSEKIKNFFFLPTVSAQNSVILSNRQFSQDYTRIKTVSANLNQLQRLKMHNVVSQNANMKRMSLMHTDIEQELNNNKNIIEPLMQENMNLMRQFNGTRTSNVKNPQVCEPPKCTKQPETFKPQNFTNLILPKGGGGGGTCISNEHALLKPKTTIANGEIIKINTETQIVSFDLKNEASCSIELDKLNILLVGPLVTSSQKINLGLYYKVNNQEKKVSGVSSLPQEEDKKFDLKKLLMPPNSELEFNISIDAPDIFKNKNYHVEVKASKNIDVWDGELAQTEPYSIKSSTFVIQE